MFAQACLALTYFNRVLKHFFKFRELHLPIKLVTKYEESLKKYNPLKRMAEQ